MNILFIHQNFPGQYKNIIKTLGSSNGIQLVSLGVEEIIGTLPNNLSAYRYGIPKGNTPDIHPWLLESESKIIRGESCARAAHELKTKGFVPDLICAHPGWGESLFIRQIWPHTPILHYQEFYYQNSGFDTNFDSEIQGICGEWQEKAKLKVKNASLLLSLEDSNWNVCPTNFQKSSFPDHWQKAISVIHDGIDTKAIKPNNSVAPLQLPDGTSVSRKDKIITFVNRTLEPYRGCHTFIRAIPEIQRQCPDARIVVVGETKGVSYGGACKKGEWKDQFLKEIDGKYDPTNVYFTGGLPYHQFLHLLQLSKVHIYLTYPFVLSWSLLEAMSSACAIVGSDTEPVREVISHRQNGLLVNFFDPQELAESVAELLNNRDLANTFGNNARNTILKNYSIQQCVPRHIALMQLVASGGINRR